MPNLQYMQAGISGAGTTEFGKPDYPAVGLMNEWVRGNTKEVREQGRSTQGVRLINLDAGEKLVGMQTVVEADEEEE